MKSMRPILILEDDTIDVMTLKRALKGINLNNEIIVAGNGEEGLHVLEKGTIASLIFLDINMPRMNGIEFLKALRSEERFKHIPVIIMTTSKEDEEKMESFRLGVAGYMLKPMDYTKFFEIIKTIDYYWTLSEMPVK